METSQPQVTDNAPEPQTRGQVIAWPQLYNFILWVSSRGKERAFRTMVADLVQLQPGEAVLDVGCGTGTQAVLAKERVGPSGTVCGIEPSRRMIDYARRQATRRGLSLNFQTGVIEKLNFPAESFDVALCIIVFHHMPDDLKLQGLKEIVRVLKPEGRLLVVDSNLQLLPSFEKEGFALLKSGTIPFFEGYDFAFWQLTNKTKVA